MQQELLDHSQLKKGMNNIPYVQFKQNIQNYAQEEQDLLEWLWSYSANELNHSKAALSEAVGYDWTVIFKIFNGSYEASLDRFCESVRALAKKTSGARAFIETPVTRRINEALDYCRDNSTMVTISGPTGRSKTHSVQHWVNNPANQGRARYIRIPSGCSRSTLTVLISKAIGSSAYDKTVILEQRIMKVMNFRNTLVIDEAGHLIPKGTAASRGAIELLRDIHDICHAGIAMVFTDCYLEQLRNGQNADFFEQFVGRIGYRVQIPAQVRKDEIIPIIKSFTDSPSEKLINYATKVARERDGKLRTLFEDLKRATEWAKSQNRKLQFEDLKISVDWRLSGGIWKEDVQ